MIILLLLEVEIEARIIEWIADTIVKEVTK